MMFGSQDEPIAMAKVEGDIYEGIAKLWFLLKGYDKDEIEEGHMGARGIDFSFKSVGHYYEVKGRQLIQIATTYWRKQPRQILQIKGVTVKNIDLEKMTNLLIVIYDNFADRFRLFNLTTEEMQSIITANGYISFYKLFELKKAEKPLKDIKEVNIEDRKSRACRIPFDVTYQGIVNAHTHDGKTDWRAVSEDLRNLCGL